MDIESLRELNEERKRKAAEYAARLILTPEQISQREAELAQQHKNITERMDSILIALGLKDSVGGKEVMLDLGGDDTGDSYHATVMNKGDSVVVSYYVLALADLGQPAVRRKLGGSDYFVRRFGGDNASATVGFYDEVVWQGVVPISDSEKIRVLEFAGETMGNLEASLDMLSAALEDQLPPAA